MSSADYFLAFQELNLDGTLGVVPATNPLLTAASVANNAEDIDNQLRNTLVKNVNKQLPFAIPTSVDALDQSVSDAFLCWLRSNNTEMQDLMNSWAEDMKYGFSNDSLLSDTDPTTNSYYNLFFEYVRLITKRYFKRTKEFALMEHFLPRSEKSIIELYFMFRKYYFDLVYKKLYNSLYVDLFSGVGGFIDVAGSLQFLMTGFRLLDTSLTYGSFLDLFDELCFTSMLFLSTTGPLGEFLLNYGSFPFAGQNICKFEDNLECLLCRLNQVPGDMFNTSELITFIISGSTTVPATDAYNTGKFESFLYNRPPKSIIQSLMNILIAYILHLLDKFVPFTYTDPITSSSPTDYIDTNGANVLLLLLEYIVGGSLVTTLPGTPAYTNVPFASLNNRFSKSCKLSDQDIATILSPPSVNSDGTFPIIESGVLSFITANLRILLSSSDDILLLSPTNSEMPVISLPRLAAGGTSYFGGTFAADWTTQQMADSTVNVPSNFPLSLIIDYRPQNTCNGNYISLESEIIELTDQKRLERVLASYACTYANHIEGINIPSQDPYMIPSVTVVGTTITSYDSFEFDDFQVDFTDSPESHQSFRFLCECCDCENVPKNPNIKCFKYYALACINYMLYSILRNSLSIDPTLVLDDLSFPFALLPLVDDNTYVYTNNTQSTADLIKLFYMTQQWNTLLFDSFFGASAYFDSANLPTQIVCTGWSTTPLIKNLFYLFYKYDPEFLRLMITDIMTISESNTTLIDNLVMRLTNLERVLRVNGSQLPPTVLV